MKTELILDKTEIERIILDSKVCFVGFVDKENKPYVIPMNFGYQDNIIYLHSAPDGGLVDIVSNNPNICITFNKGEELIHQHEKVACSYRMRSESVICHGKVRFIDENQHKIDILNIIMRQYVKDRTFKYSQPAVDNVKIWEVPIDKLTAKAFGVPHSGPKVINAPSF